MVLSIDIETYSGYDLKGKKGVSVYKYVEHSDFTILILAYSYNDGRKGVCYPFDSGIPEQLKADILDDEVIKTSFNAMFERICLSAFLGVKYLNPKSWRCTMVLCGILGLPMQLETAAKVLGLNAQKDKAGEDLIKFFCKPKKPTKKNPSTRNYPKEHPEKFDSFIRYCVQDVAVEVEILEKLSFYKVSEFEQQLWCLDQKINDRGVLMDIPFAKAVVEIDEENAQRVKEEAFAAFGIDSLKSHKQVKEFIYQKTGIEVQSLDKRKAEELYAELENFPEVLRMLNYRSEANKTSIGKYYKILECANEDNRGRGFFQFYGASRTGRWAGRLVQLQNLTRNKMAGSELEHVRELIGMKDVELLMMVGSYNISTVLSELIRCAFIPSEGCSLIASDFSAIEAVVLAYLSGEKWRLDVFKNKGDIYIASASKMFGVPADKIDKKTPEGSALRQKGKVSELALGYGGGAGALIQMGALAKGSGIVEDDLPFLVKAWRKANANIVRFWYDIQALAIDAVKGTPGTHKSGISFRRSKNGMLLIVGLPSGRSLHYFKPKIVEGAYGDMLTYEGWVNEENKTTGAKIWGEVRTYGGKLVENIVQAYSRDCLALAMVRLDAAGYKIVMHVHDEAVIEHPTNQINIQEVDNIMSQPISWAPNLPLRAVSSIFKFYQKD